MKIGGFLAVLIVLVTSSHAILDNYGYAESQYTDIRVSTLKYEPYPAQPGKYVDIWIKVENAGQETDRDVEFTLIPKYPFTLGENEAAVKQIGDLGGKQSSLLHYLIRVDSSAVEGENLIDYKLKSRGGIKSGVGLNIYVQTSDANIAVDSVSAEQLTPGKVTQVTLQLTNEGDTPLTDISVKLDLTATTIPIAPVNSTSEKKLYLIEAHKTSPLTFQLMALPDAASNTYKVPITIKFIDNSTAFLFILTWFYKENLCIKFVFIALSY